MQILGQLQFETPAAKRFDQYRVIAYAQSLATEQLPSEPLVLESPLDPESGEFSIDWSQQAPAIDWASVRVRVKSPTGATLIDQAISQSELEQRSIKLIIPYIAPLSTGHGASAVSHRQQLKGRLLDLTGQPVAAGTALLLWAQRQGDPTLKPVLAASTDAWGGFSAGYPVGQFLRACATVANSVNESLDTALSVDLEPAFDTAAQAPAQPALAFPEFIYLATRLKPNAAAAAHDCGCESATGNWLGLPDQAELTQQNSAYSQDIGAGCMNLTTPNRTLEEFMYTLAVRTTDPDIKGLTLSDIDRRAPQKGINLHADLIAKVDKNISLKQALAMPLAQRAGLQALLTDAASASGLGKSVAERGELTAQNSVDWDSDPTFYQAVTIAHGHILTYKQVWKAAGYSLGDLLYSVPLAPGQKKNIVIFDWARNNEGSQSDTTQFDAQLDSFLSHQRDINDIVRSRLSENSAGASSARTSARSGGAGLSAMVPLGKVFLGVSGGFSANSSQASSSAWQNASREIAANTNNQLRDQVMQRASEVRNQRSTVVLAARQAEKFKVETEVIANHNHCHALTIQYFEVLRHYVVQQTLAQVQPCLFIPLQMSVFDTAKIVRWQDILRQHFIAPATINEGGKPLIEGFEATERLFHQYAGSDLPLGSYADDALTDMTGSFVLRLNIKRPSPPDKDEGWLPLYNHYLFRSGLPLDVIKVKLSAADIAQRDALFEADIAPKIAEAYINTLQVDAIDEAGQRIALGLDVSLVSDYRRDQALYVTLRANALPSGLTRRRIQRVVIYSMFDLSANEGSKAVVLSGRLEYRTAHYADSLFEQQKINDDLSNVTGFGTSQQESVSLYTPLSPAELRNPRHEDVELSLRLAKHLNAHLEHYHKAIWYNMDADRRFMLLDGFYAPNAGGKSVASVVENTVIGIAGNSLIMPVAPGYQLDPTYQLLRHAPAALDANAEPSGGQQALFNHYLPLTPSPAYRVSVPTRGVFTEAIQGACNACEPIEEGRRDWASKDLDEPTAINPVQTQAPQYDPGFTDQLKPTPMAQPVVTIQNAPAAPAPGAGLADAFKLLGQASMFKDITGLDGNIKNAMQNAALSTEAAKHYADVSAELAKTMAVLNNDRAKKIQEQADKAHKDGTISKDQHQQYTQKNLENQLGMGNLGNNNQPAASDATGSATAKPAPLAQQALDTLKQLGVGGTLSSSDKDGGSVSLSIPSVDAAHESFLLDNIYPLKQSASQLCWATAATIMDSWRAQSSLSVESVVMKAGLPYIDWLRSNQALPAMHKPRFIEALDMVAEPLPPLPQVLLALLKQFGPLWFTTDADSATGAGHFSPHARILMGYKGNESLGSVQLILLDPATGSQVQQSYTDCMKLFAQMATDNTSGQRYTQLVRFRSPRPGAQTMGEGQAEPSSFDAFIIDGIPRNSVSLGDKLTTIKNLFISLDSIRQTFYKGSASDLKIASQLAVLSKCIGDVCIKLNGSQKHSSIDSAKKVATVLKVADFFVKLTQQQALTDFQNKPNKDTVKAWARASASLFKDASTAISTSLGKPLDSYFAPFEQMLNIPCAAVDWFINVMDTRYEAIDSITGIAAAHSHSVSDGGKVVWKGLLSDAYVQAGIAESRFGINNTDFQKFWHEHHAASDNVCGVELYDTTLENGLNCLLQMVTMDSTISPNEQQGRLAFITACIRQTENSKLKTPVIYD